MNKVSRHSRTALLALLTSGILVGCQSTPVSNASVVVPATTIEASAEQTPELNIPESVLDADCNCSDLVVTPEETDFDRGVRALAARDYPQALRYFQSHAQTEDVSASREAEIGLAFIAVLRADGTDQSNSEALDDRAEVMALALALLTQLESQVSRLDEVNTKLASDLEKREAVLKRLRELTLGQLED
ncbi:MAG: hypothetical protein P8O92_11620 [Luminiphilus sp.]|nr:hypothetical protein [Luminiphilus sp.]